MNLPPAWKMKREVWRIWSQIVGKAIPPIELVIQKRYDAKFSKVTLLIDGHDKFSKKVAIFFIYQPVRLAKSILVTCEFLQDHGYSILLVSSTALNDFDLKALQNVTCKILLRPNYGYDFGGYRDGIRMLQLLGVKPEMLLIMNDSMWLPLCSDSSMIKEMEEQSLNVIGPVFESVIKREKHKEYFQSYLILLKEKAINSSVFVNYWRNYRVTSRKEAVLVRGEEDFSGILFKSGFGGNTPSTRAILFDLIKKQSNHFLMKTLDYSTHLVEEDRLEAQNLVRTYADTDEWRGSALSHINNMPTNTQPMGIIPYACVKLLGFSFLKKSSFPPEHDGMRWQYLRAVTNGDLPSPHPDILAEIKASKMDPTLTTDPSISSAIPATKAK